MNNDEQSQDMGIQDENAQTELGEDELSLLKGRAKLMGLKFSNNISLETLREKVLAKQKGDVIVDETKEEQEEEVVAKVNPLASAGSAAEAEPVKKLSLREYMIQTQMKLIRLRIQNLDPKKKDLPGEIFSVSNEFLGTVKKYVPYGEASDDGYHVPYCIYTELETRRFQNIRTYTDKITKQIKIETSWTREFSIEVLEPLTFLLGKYFFTQRF